MTKPNKAVYALLLLVTSAIWGFAFVAQVAGAEYVRPFAFNGVRFALGALSLVPVILIFERGKGAAPGQWRGVLSAGVVAGSVLFAASTLQQYGVEMTGSAGKSGFITGLYTVIVPVIGVFMGKRSRPFIWIGAALACAGLYMLCAPGELRNVGKGDLMLLIGALFWAGHIIAVDRYAGKFSALRFSAAQFAVCSALSLICAFICEDVSLRALYLCKMPLLYSGILSVGVAYTLQSVGQRGVEPSRAAIIFSTESLFSVIGGALLLGETMDGRGYAGCALIFAGIITAQMRAKTKKPERM
jgi:drug/metabolite transporter (DMT)-like permease